MLSTKQLISNCHVIVSGNIASGKTTLVNQLEEKLRFAAAHESVEGNPYLPYFYEDMSKWSFHVAMYFLGDRANKHQNLATTKGLRVADRSIYEDIHVFLPFFLETKIITRQEYDTYTRLARLFETTLPKPNLHIHLYAPTSVLLERIRNRNREIESGITAAYLEGLEKRYQKWTKTSNLCPILKIDSGKLDYTKSGNSLPTVVALIENVLGGILT